MLDDPALREVLDVLRRSHAEARATVARLERLMREGHPPPDIEVHRIVMDRIRKNLAATEAYQRTGTGEDLEAMRAAAAGHRQAVEDLQRFREENPIG